jgi:hypothetical protein
VNLRWSCQADPAVPSSGFDGEGEPSAVAAPARLKPALRVDGAEAAARAAAARAAADAAAVAAAEAAAAAAALQARAAAVAPAPEPSPSASAPPPPPPQAPSTPSLFAKVKTDVEMQGRVRESINHAWSNYKKYAWGHDNLHPISKSSSSNFLGTFSVAAPWALLMPEPPSACAVSQAWRRPSWTRSTRCTSPALTPRCRRRRSGSLTTFTSRSMCVWRCSWCWPRCCAHASLLVGAAAVPRAASLSALCHRVYFASDVCVRLSSASQKEVNVFETTIRVMGGLLAAYEMRGSRVFLERAQEVGDALMVAFNT